MKITKAIIPVAGWGTRMLPITKSIEKCMLPIGNRPLVDYLVQECINAGIEEIIFVVSDRSEQLRSYYSSNLELEEHLRQKGSEKIDTVKVPANIKFTYLVQNSMTKYGTAVPVALVSEILDPEESVVVIMGDNFFYNNDGSSDIARLLDGTPEGGAGVLGAVLAASDTITDRYGSIEVDENDNLIKITEHPDVLPEPFIKNVSMYILNPPLLRAVRDYVDSDTPQLNGEYGIFDAYVDVLANKETTMKLVRAKGQYLDGGYLAGWLHANNIVSRNY